MGEIQRSSIIPGGTIVIALLHGAEYSIALFVNFEGNNKSLHSKNDFERSSVYTGDAFNIERKSIPTYLLISL